MFRIPDTEPLTSGQLAKLPKWAQNHIAAVERERDAYKSDSHGLRDAGRVKGTEQFYIHGGRDPIWFPAHTAVHLSTPDSDAVNPDYTHRVSEQSPFNAAAELGAVLSVSTRGIALGIPQVTNGVAIVSKAR